MIDILIPVLGRPDSAAPLVENIHSATVEPFRITFICSPGDDEEIESCMSTGEDVIVMSRPAGRSDYPKKMNAAFRDTEGEWLLLGSDDIRFEAGWDTKSLDVAEKSLANVVATNDLANMQVRRGLFGTHCLIRRSYVTREGASADGPGVLVHEGYDHNFCDREICGVARSRNVFVFALRAVIRHQHPNFNRRVQMDATYRKGVSNFRRDQALFMQRARLWGYEGLSSQEVRSAQGRRKR